MLVNGQCRDEHLVPALGVHELLSMAGKWKWKWQWQWQWKLRTLTLTLCGFPPNFTTPLSAFGPAVDWRRSKFVLVLVLVPASLQKVRCIQVPRAWPPTYLRYVVCRVPILKSHIEAQ